MSSTIAIAATYAYRYKVRHAAAVGGDLPRAAFMAVGSGNRPYTLDDTAMEAEWLRIAVNYAESGVMLTLTGTITGVQAGSNIIREVGIFANDGTLMGRRVVSAKELEPESEIEFELVFQY